MCASDGAHVFMHSGAPVQLVTLAQRVAPRNTADVQMFLLGKQTEQRPFYPGQRACQNKSGPPPAPSGPLLQGDPSGAGADDSSTSPPGLFCRMFVQPAHGRVKVYE